MHEDHRQMIDDCEDRESRLTAWESEFIESISEWTGNLTEKQAEVLEKILDRVTG